MKIELFLQLPDKVLAQAFHMAFGDDCSSDWTEMRKAEAIRNIITSDELYGCSVEKWQTVMDYLKKEVENTQTKYDKPPLYKQLNEQRTQGKLKVSGINHLKNENGVLFALTHGPNGAWGEVQKEHEANAAYTCLAVNNLHILAQALENFMGLSNDKNGISLQGQKAFYELKKHCPQIWDWLQEGSIALKNIS